MAKKIKGNPAVPPIQRPANPTVAQARAVKFNGRLRVQALKSATEAVGRLIARFSEAVGQRQPSVFWTVQETPYVTPDLRVCLPVPRLTDENGDPLPDEQVQDAIDRLVMFRDHEFAHILFTDLSAPERLLNHDGGRGRNVTAKNIWNFLEDIRIEAEFSRFRAGSAANFVRFYERNARELRELLAQRDSMVDAAMMAALLRVKGVKFTLPHPLVGKALDAVWPVVSQVVDMTTKPKAVEEARAQAVLCERLALKIYDLLKDLFEQEQQAAGDEASDDADAGDSGDADGETGDAGDGDGETGGSDGSAQSRGAKRKAGAGKSAAGDADGDDAGDTDGDDADSADDKAQAGSAGGEPPAKGQSGGKKQKPAKGRKSASAADDKADESGSDGGAGGAGETGRVEGFQFDSTGEIEQEINEIRAADATVPPDEQAQGQIKNRGEKTPEGDHLLNLNRLEAPSRSFGGHSIRVIDVGSLAQQHAVEPFRHFGRQMGMRGETLARLLIGQNRRWVLPKQETGRLNTRRLHDVVTGLTNRVFVNQFVTRANSVAITLLIDCSSSMTAGTQMPDAIKAAFGLAEVCVRAQVRFAISGYFSNSEVVYQRAVHFGVPWNSKAQAAVVALKPTGGTPTGDAILEASRQMAGEAADRHIIFVITDGNPNDTAYNIEAVDAVRRGGVEVYAFGIPGASAQLLTKVYGEGQYTHCASTAHDVKTEIVDKLVALLLPATDEYVNKRGL